MATGRIYYYEKRGVYQAIVENGRDERGKRVQIFRDAKTEKEARQILQTLLRELDDGTFVAPSDLTVAEYLESWLADVVRHQVGARTRDRYEGIAACHLAPRLGAMKLSALRPDQIQRCYSDLLDAGLSLASVHKVHVVLHSALRSAVRTRLIARSPCDDLVLPRIRTPEIKALTDKEIGAMLAAADGSRVAVPLLVLVSLGVRRGELLALQWDDVDLEASTVSVRRTLGVVSGRASQAAEDGAKLARHRPAGVDSGRAPRPPRRSAACPPGCRQGIQQARSRVPGAGRRTMEAQHLRSRLPPCIQEGGAHLPPA